MKIKKPLTEKIGLLATGFMLIFSFSFASLAANTETTYAHTRGDHQDKSKTWCGKGKSHVHTRFDLGCNGAHVNPIIDMIFGFIRFLSVGVGIVVIASVAYSGIAYSASQGNPEKTAQAKSRIQTSIMALVFYLFIFAIVQFLVPGGLFG